MNFFFARLRVAASAKQGREDGSELRLRITYRLSVFPAILNNDNKLTGSSQRPGKFLLFLNSMTKKRIVLICLVLLTVGIKIFALFPDAVERYYATGIYPVISRGQRFLFGWLPFSVGDIFYGAIVIYFIYKLVDLIKRVRKKRADKSYWRGGLVRLVIFVLIVYTSFNLFWGLNYNRRGIAYQLDLTTGKVNKEDLIAVMEQLMLKVNKFDSVGKLERSQISNEKYLISGAISSYASLGKKNINFNYKTPSIKPSLFSYLGNYLGYTGYYNPFSG
ncbi:MAG TPA: DUF3810 family protein, partial [Ignavibacteriaceae bacterium]